MLPTLEVVQVDPARVDIPATNTRVLCRYGLSGDVVLDATVPVRTPIGYLRNWLLGFEDVTLAGAVDPTVTVLTGCDIHICYESDSLASGRILFDILPETLKFKHTHVVLSLIHI